MYAYYICNVCNLISEFVWFKNVVHSVLHTEYVCIAERGMCVEKDFVNLKISACEFKNLQIGNEHFFLLLIITYDGGRAYIPYCMWILDII